MLALFEENKLNSSAPKLSVGFKDHGMAAVSLSCNESLDFILSSEKYYSVFSKTNIPV